LIELESVTKQVKRLWPHALDRSVTNTRAKHPELWKLSRKRDRLSDSVRIFAAMAVEAFINFYGIIRLGEAEYTEHFERLGIVPKLRVLLLVCDSISLGTSDQLVVSLRRIADERNTLVHPKAKELPRNVPAKGRGGARIPDSAREAVADMKKFFQEFGEAVPGVRHLLPAEQRPKK